MTAFGRLVDAHLFLALSPDDWLYAVSVVADGQSGVVPTMVPVSIRVVTFSTWAWHNYRVSTCGHDSTPNGSCHHERHRTCRYSAIASSTVRFHGFAGMSIR